MDNQPTPPAPDPNAADAVPLSTVDPIPEYQRNHDADTGAIMGIVAIIPFAALFIVPFGYWYSIRGFRRAKRENDQKARMNAGWGISLASVWLLVNLVFIIYYVPDMVEPGPGEEVANGYLNEEVRVRWAGPDLQVGVFSIAFEDESLRGELEGIDEKEKELRAEITESHRAQYASWVRAGSDKPTSIAVKATYPRITEIIEQIEEQVYGNEEKDIEPYAPRQRLLTQHGLSPETRFDCGELHPSSDLYQEVISRNPSDAMGSLFGELYTELNLPETAFEAPEKIDPIVMEDNFDGVILNLQYFVTQNFLWYEKTNEATAFQWRFCDPVWYEDPEPAAEEAAEEMDQADAPAAEMDEDAETNSESPETMQADPESDPA